jgi:hypothetical protein
VQVAAGQAHETVHLVDWEHPDRKDFALAEEVTLKERGAQPVRDPVRGASPDGRAQLKLTYTESCLGPALGVVTDIRAGLPSPSRATSGGRPPSQRAVVTGAALHPVEGSPLRFSEWLSLLELLSDSGFGDRFRPRPGPDSSSELLIFSYRA